MKNTVSIILALANAATSLASAAAAVAESLGGQPGSASAPQAEDTDEPAEAPKRRGRPAKTAAADEDDSPPPAAKGKTLDELKGIIAPAIKGGKGNDVTGIIEKHAGAGKKLKDLAEMPEKHKAFEKDIAAISLETYEEY